MRLNIIILHLNNFKLTLDDVSRKETTLHQLKKEIQDKKNIEIKRMSLVFNNIELVGNFTLDKYGIIENSNIELIFNDCPKFPYGRFNHSATNFKLFKCTNSCPDNFIKGISFTPDENGNFLINDVIYNVYGGTSSLTFIQNPLQQWVLPDKPIYRDISELKPKCSNTFRNTAYTMTKSEKLSLLSNNRIKR